VEVVAAPERVFQALASKEITEWWVRPGVFDTREWTGEVRAGGRWRASGMTRGEPYVQEGEFLEVESPRWLVHTWERAGKPDAASTVTYLVERSTGGRASRFGTWASRRATCAARSRSDGKRAWNGSPKSLLRSFH
jgi:uncharacterized protein YndB with AHSA1/START domain